MTRRKTEEDLLNPSRLFSRLLNDYSDGRLSKPWIKLFRARVEAVDTEGGMLENPPPNPPNSIRARIYSNGLDVNLPSSALSVFHPLFPGHLAPPLSPGEHVYVIFEDASMSHGLWISPISSYHDLNLADPDQRQEEDQRNSSNVFEGDSPRQSRPARTYEYGGATIETQGRQEIIDNFEVTGDNNPWRNKRILMIGDSQVGGATKENGERSPTSALSRVLERKLITEQGASFFMAQGRVGWGVINWVEGTFSGQRRGLRIPQPSVTDLIQEYYPDIVLVILGGNDGSTGAFRRNDYSQFVSRLWSQLSSVPMKLWIGPPTSVGNAANKQPDRIQAAQKIKAVTSPNYIDSFALTNTTDGRDRLGVHFTPSSSALEPWANAIIRKGFEMQ